MRIAVALLAALLVAGTASAARLVGTTGNDVLVGTARADTILGREGRDRLAGRAGADFLHGGPGRDSIDGGAGADRIVAQYDDARDTVRCGPGVDVVNADLVDSVRRDCELVGRRLSRDPYTDADSQHETQVEPDSLTVGRTTVTAYQVGRRFDGAATNIGYAVSYDDGQTWRNGLLPGLTTASRPAGRHARASDPVVAFDATHGVWLISTLAVETPATRLTVSASANGVTWGDAVVATEASSSGGIALDKNWLTCDNGPTSPHRGRCYLAYTDNLRDDRLAVVTSSDGGLTWSAPVDLPGTSSAVGALPVVRPNGDLVVVYLWEERRIGASLSSDGAVSFGPPVEISDVQARAARGLRFFPLPAADVDPRTGAVWVTWHDCRFGSGCATNSVVASTSADGRTWGSPTRVTSGRNAFLPTVGIHPTTGRVAFAYHVVRPGGGIDVELVESRASGTGWLAPRRLSARTMRPEWLPDTVSGRMLADYISVHYAGARPLVLWVLASEPVGSGFRQAVYATRG
jgi:RTX calcium-binding nonapeptide repeat (4 copies)